MSSIEEQIDQLSIPFRTGYVIECPENTDIPYMRVNHPIFGIGVLFFECPDDSLSETATGYSYGKTITYRRYNLEDILNHANVTMLVLVSSDGYTKRPYPFPVRPNN